MARTDESPINFNLPKCPQCGITSKDTIHGGKFGICKNAKCNAEVFENKDFTGTGTDDGAHSTSYNNSYRGNRPGA